MALSQVATHIIKSPSTPSTLSQKAPDVVFLTSPAREHSYSKRPSSSDGAVTTKTTKLTRPKVRRRGHSATSPSASGPNYPPSTPDSRPKTSPTVTSPVQIFYPTQTFTSISLSSPAQQSHPGSGGEVRSPTSRRPPAFRSCHGIETSRGPPPALITRAYSSEHTWSPPANKENPPKLTPHALAQLDAANSNKKDVEDASTNIDTDIKKPTEPKILTSAETPAQEKPSEEEEEGMVATLLQPQSELAMDRERKRYSLGADKRASQRLSTQLDFSHLAPREDRSEKSSQEDLFLHMAQAEGEDDETIHGSQEQRKALLTHPAYRPSVSRGQSSEQTAREQRSSFQRQEAANEFSTPPSLDRYSTRERTYAASAHPLEGRYNSRLSNFQKPLPSVVVRGKERKDVLESPSLVGKRYSGVETYQPRGYRPRHLRNGTDGNQLSSPITAVGRQHMEQEASPPLPKAEGGTESSISTTAPSTVWDELDDLKSRIRKLELTGRIPPSSGAAMSTANTERPRTATTAATTMSSSPKRNQGQGTSPTTPSLDEPSPHPLLSAALAKVKPCLKEATYRALEATASDAQTLAKMASGGVSGSVPGAVDRQLKRKADNMCRNLTELCITIADKGTDSDRPLSRAVSRAESRARSASRDGIVLHNSIKDDAIDSRFQRAKSLDPEPTSTQRVLSRLEARRISLHRDDFTSSNASPSQDQYPEAKTPTQATLNRTSTVLSRLRRNADDEGDNTIRPLSRAATELGRANTTGHTTTSTLSSKRVSREYTSNHPLPSPETRALAAQSYLPQRRSYLSNGNGNGNGYGEPRTPQTPGFSSQRRYLSQAGEVSGSMLESRRRSGLSGQYGSSGRSLLGGPRLERKGNLNGEGGQGDL